jgi:hypothetical protein
MKKILGIFLFLFLLTHGAFSFTDVPPDHWAYDAVEKLTKEGYMDGYLDGTFKGRKVITRYELALILARILDKMENFQAKGGTISEEDQQLVRKLTAEFKDELNSLGVRVEDLEKKVSDIEKKQNEPKKLKIFGYYEATDRLVQDFHTTVDDPFNYDSQDDMDAYDRNGLSPLNNKVNLRILATPFPNVEAYLELEHIITGSQLDKYYYTDNYADIDDFNYPTLFEKKSERRAYPIKMHLKVKAPLTDVRVFAGEGINPLNDPFKLTTDKSWLYDPYQGVELSKTKGNISFFAALYQQDEDEDINTPNDNSIGRQINNYRGKQYDTYIFHPTFVIPKEYMKNGSLVLGATYLEYAEDYTHWGDYNRVLGTEFNYNNRAEGDLKVSGEIIRTEDGLDGNGILKDIGYKVDASYHLGQFTYTLNHYKYGRDMRLRTNDIEGLFQDYDKYKNGYKYWDYGRKVDSTDELLEQGETYVKLTAKYDYDNKPGEKDFKMEGTIMQKWWEQDPENIKESDYYKGEKYALESWMDLTLKTKLRWYISLIKDALPNEIGTTFLETELTSSIMHDKVNVDGRFWIERDADSVNLEGDSALEYGIYGEASADISDRLSLKGNIEAKVQNDGWNSGNVDPSDISNEDDKRDNTEKHQIESQLEADFDLNDKISLNGIMKGRWESWPSYPELDRDTYWLIGTIKNNMSDKLKSKTVWWWKQIRNSGDPVDIPSFTNIYSELIYEASDKTTLKMIWGDWISVNKDDREEWGMDSIPTEKKIYLEATTEF